jgi:cell division protein FtsZ
VNEASCVIQEAAHEDANIIFGAVVDPDLVGKVKITVIATGFDRKTSRVSATGVSQTPVDMTRYQEYAQRVAAAAGAGPVPVEPVEAPPQPISRRPTIEVPLRSVDPGVKRASAAGNGEASDLSSQFDVPAFLRRT